MESEGLELSAYALLLMAAAAFGAGYAFRAFLSYRRRRRWLAEMGIAAQATRASRL
jgi:hypothetical protein